MHPPYNLQNIFKILYIKINAYYANKSNAYYANKKETYIFWKRNVTVPHINLFVFSLQVCH